MEQDMHQPSFGDKWQAARPTKTAFFWSCVASAVVTMIIGFTWGGWVRGATAQSIAEARAEDAVATRLAHICVFQARQDPARDQKIKELRNMGVYSRADYVAKQGWAKMPGEQGTDNKVAEDCAELLTEHDKAS
jgi:hypothetical protein